MAAANGPPTPLTAEEKVQLLVAQTKLEQARVARTALADQRDRYLEAKIRQAIEEWYQAPEGRQYGQAIANVQTLERSLTTFVDAMRKVHNAQGHNPVGDNLEWKPVEPAK